MSHAGSSSSSSSSSSAHQGREGDNISADANLNEALIELSSSVLDAVIPILPPRPPSSAPPASLAASQFHVARSIVTRLAAPLEDADGLPSASGRGSSSSSQPSRPPQPPPPSTKPSIDGLASIIPDILRLCSARAAPVRDAEIQRLLTQALDLERDALNNIRELSVRPRLLGRLAVLARGIQHLSEEMMTDIRTHHRKRSDASTASQPHSTSNRPISPHDAAASGGASTPSNISQESLILTAPPGTAADQFRRHVQSDVELTMRRGEVYAVWGGEEKVKANFNEWVQASLTDAPTRETLRWRASLLDTIFSDQPVRLPVLPTRANLDSDGNPIAATPGQNTLPHALIAGASAIFDLQNKVQAVVVLACLVTIVTSAVGSRAVSQHHRPAGNAAGSGNEASSEQDTWVLRLWTLLEDFIAEPDQPRPTEASTPTSSAPNTSNPANASAQPRPAPAEAERTRLRNLTAECIRSYRDLRGLSSTVTTATPAAQQDEATIADERKIEAGVRAVLRYEDPVFKVFRKRLYAAFTQVLLSPSASSSSAQHTAAPAASPGAAHSPLPGSPATSTSPVPLPIPPASPRAGVPARLATGRTTASASTSQTTAAAAAARNVPLKLPPVPGLSRPALLADKANEVVREVDAVCRAIVKVWAKDLGIE
ncbi:hypothetical protein V8E36_001966 [Tilletia maclaganii]